MAYGPLPPPPSRSWRSDEQASPPDDVTRPREPAAAPTRDRPPAAPGGGQQWQPPGGPSQPGTSEDSGFGQPSGLPPESERPVWADAEPPGERSATDGMAIAALVLGILGLLTSVFVFGGVLGLIALGLGIVGIRRQRQRGIAIAGVVTGVLAILVSIAVVAAGVALFRAAPDAIRDEMEGIGGEVSSGGELRADSPCADADETASFPASLSEGGLTVTAVDVCADPLDDFEFGVQVANESDAPIDAQISVVALDGDTSVSQPPAETVTLEPGSEGWVRIFSFDDYAAFDSVDVEASVS